MKKKWVIFVCAKARGKMPEIVSNNTTKKGQTFCSWVTSIWLSV